LTRAGRTGKDRLKKIFSGSARSTVFIEAAFREEKRFPEDGKALIYGIKLF